MSEKNSHKSHRTSPPAKLQRPGNEAKVHRHIQSMMELFFSLMSHRRQNEGQTCRMERMRWAAQKSHEIHSLEKRNHRNHKYIKTQELVIAGFYQK